MFWFVSFFSQRHPVIVKRTPKEADTRTWADRERYIMHPSGEQPLQGLSTGGTHYEIVEF